jgi:hypothetical protein
MPSSPISASLGMTSAGKWNFVPFHDVRGRFANAAELLLFIGKVKSTWPLKSADFGE